MYSLVTVGGEKSYFTSASLFTRWTHAIDRRDTVSPTIVSQFVPHPLQKSIRETG